MSIPKMTNDLAVIQKLSDLPNATEGLTAEELKAKFDEAALEIQKYINEKLIPAIMAEKIPFVATSEINAENVDAAIRDVQRQVKDASSGTIVNGSVTKEKLAAALLARVYGGRPWVSLNTPDSRQNTGADFPIGQIWLRPAFTVENRAGTNWVASGCTVTAGENRFTVTGNNTVVTATATQALTNIGQDGDRVYVLFSIANRDSELTALTVSLNSGEERDASAGVFSGTLAGGALTVQFSATWPSTSLAGGSFDVAGFAVVNVDAALRQTAGAEDKTDWAGFLNGLLPLESYTSPEELFIQTTDGSWWPMSYAVQPTSRGGTGNGGVGYGEMLYGSGGEAMERLGAAAENNSFLQFVDGRPAWKTAGEAAGNTGIARIATGSYTGTGVSGTVKLPCAPKALWLVQGNANILVLQGLSNTGGYTGTYKNTYTGETATTPYTAGVDLNQDALRFWFTYNVGVTNYQWLSGDAVHWNTSGVTYHWVAIY